LLTKAKQMEKNVTIPTDESKFYRQYLEILNPIINLRGKELDVLAELLFHNNRLKDIPEDLRWKLIFEADTKTSIRDKLNLSEASLNNNLTGLRKKRIIVERKVIKNFLVRLDENFSLKFNFKMKKSESNSTQENY